METTFMTIHNLTAEANILFASESIYDILGFQPQDVIGRSSFDYFHPDEVPGARVIHSRGVQMDKAAVLHYARIRNRDGQWVGCECVFTIVYEVLVACTSIYRGDVKSEQRALQAPAIRRLFASSPRDPRYHMLEHLSSKFRTPPEASLLEPRAALILNRFTRTLTVMYATNAVSDILGVTSDQFKEKSFYECIQENCLPEAIRCLESAKANDSIAYLRFWYRDPRREEDLEEEMREGNASSDSEDGGVNLQSMDTDEASPGAEDSSHSGAIISGDEQQSCQRPGPSNAFIRRTQSGESTDHEQDITQAIFDTQASRSSTSSLLMASPAVRRPRSARPRRAPVEPYEIEAVVSCTSDGLVVVLRRARPIIPSLLQPAGVPQQAAPVHANGFFAAPWGVNPIRPHLYRPNQQHPFQHGPQAPQLPVGGPPLDEFMNSIREVAVFAWSLAGINGNIASYGRGTPYGEAQPPGGLPIWDPYAQPPPSYTPPENQAVASYSRMASMDIGHVDQKTNEPGDGNLIAPFRHPRQESNLRNQNGFGAGPMGSDRPEALAQAGQGAQMAYEYQVQVQAQLDPHNPEQHDFGNNNQHRAQDQRDNPPTGQPQGPQGPSEGTQGNRYLWQ